MEKIGHVPQIWEIHFFQWVKYTIWKLYMKLTVSRKHTYHRYEFEFVLHIRKFWKFVCFLQWVITTLIQKGIGLINPFTDKLSLKEQSNLTDFIKGKWIQNQGYNITVHLTLVWVTMPCGPLNTNSCDPGGPHSTCPGCSGDLQHGGVQAMLHPQILVLSQWLWPRIPTGGPLVSWVLLKYPLSQCSSKQRNPLFVGQVCEQCRGE